MQFLETRTVSPKTSLDGKLEISKATAERLESMGAAIPVRIEVPRDAAPVDGVASLSSMECTCRKAGVLGAHVHHFLASDHFRALPPQELVAIQVEDGRVYVRPPAY
jgi:hypothetical protein